MNTDAAILSSSFKAHLKCFRFLILWGGGRCVCLTFANQEFILLQRNRCIALVWKHKCALEERKKRLALKLIILKGKFHSKFKTDCKTIRSQFTCTKYLCVILCSVYFDLQMQRRLIGVWMEILHPINEETSQ